MMVSFCCLPVNNHNSIITIGLYYFIVEAIFFDILVEVRHFITKFDDIIDDDDSSLPRLIPDKLEKMQTRFFESIDKHSIIGFCEQREYLSRVSKIRSYHLLDPSTSKIFLCRFIGKLRKFDRRNMTSKFSKFLCKMEGRISIGSTNF